MRILPIGLFVFYFFQTTLAQINFEAQFPAFLGANDAGCAGTDTVRIIVLPEPVFVMSNAFTSDGANDVFNAVFEGEIFEQYTLRACSDFGFWATHGKFYFEVR